MALVAKFYEAFVTGLVLSEGLKVMYRLFETLLLNLLGRKSVSFVQITYFALASCYFPPKVTEND
jgi:hypothetical protein